MKQKIIVLGGSFNPPTIAHQTFLLSAIEALGADLGIFVPAPYPYVKKKMAKTDHPNEVIDEKIRMEMLLAMCAEDPRLRADDLEYHKKGMSYTYHTLEALQEKYPDAVLIMLLPPTFAIQEERLRGRATEDEPTIQRRLEQSKAEVPHFGEYDYIVYNYDGCADKAAGDILAIVRAEQLSSKRNPKTAELYFSK